MTELDRVLSVKGSVLFIGGEAGVGKTKLVNEFMKIAEEKFEIGVMSGWCLSEAPVPYFPFIEAFNKYVSELSNQKEKLRVI